LGRGRSGIVGGQGCEVRLSILHSVQQGKFIPAHAMELYVRNTRMNRPAIHFA
jgi:hypothetical protein